MEDPDGYDYLLALPDGYDPDSPHRWPVVYFLHGAGQRGRTLAAVTRHGPPRFLADPPDLTERERAAGRILASTFVLIAPQCPQHEVWEDEPLLALLDRALERLQLDPRRVYLTGMSMGGFAAWSLGIRQPQRFAALAPVCGGGRLADLGSALPDRREALLSLPVRAFHGARDPSVPLHESERMVEGLQRAGHRDARLTVYPDVGHDAWVPAYADPELYAWFLRHSR